MSGLRDNDVAPRSTPPGSQLERLTEWVKATPPEVVAARLKELDDALGKTLHAEIERDLREMTT